LDKTVHAGSWMGVVHGDQSKGKTLTAAMKPIRCPVGTATAMGRVVHVPCMVLGFMHGSGLYAVIAIPASLSSRHMCEHRQGAWECGLPRVGVCGQDGNLKRMDGAQGRAEPTGRLNEEGEDLDAVSLSRCEK
jgi:hypothetical protein